MLDFKLSQIWVSLVLAIKIAIIGSETVHGTILGHYDPCQCMLSKETVVHNLHKII